MNLRGGEGAADISARAIREARDEEDITNSVHTSKAYTHIQTIPLHLAVHYKSILIFSSPSKPNFSTFPWQIGSWAAPRSHEDATMVTPPSPQQYKCDL